MNSLTTAWWRLRSWLRHPVASYHWNWKARHRPQPGVPDARLAPAD
jgi:hypothetical protein